MTPIRPRLYDRPIVVVPDRVIAKPFSGELIENRPLRTDIEMPPIRPQKERIGGRFENKSRRSF
jgi:hypothetical protein